MYEQKIIENLREFSAKYQYEDQKLSETCFRAADAIEELQSQLPKWIPVSERLPMRNTKVLLAYKQGVTLGYLGAYPKEGEKAYFHGIHGWKHTLSSVTHWQYLPEPPKGETDG